MEERTLTIRIDAQAWENFRHLVLVEKGLVLAGIEEELIRARNAGDDVGINENPLNAITRSLVRLVYESDSLASGAGDDVWAVLVDLVAAADPECNRRYELATITKPNEHAHLLGKASAR